MIRKAIKKPLQTQSHRASQCTIACTTSSSSRRLLLAVDTMASSAIVFLPHPCRTTCTSRTFTFLGHGDAPLIILEPRPMVCINWSQRQFHRTTCLTTARIDSRWPSDQVKMTAMVLPPRHRHLTPRYFRTRGDKLFFPSQNCLRVFSLVVAFQRTPLRPWQQRNSY